METIASKYSVDQSSFFANTTLGFIFFNLLFPFTRQLFLISLSNNFGKNIF